MRCRVVQTCGVIVAVAALASWSGGQEPPITPVPAVARRQAAEAAQREAILGKKISLRLEQVTLKQALDSIAVLGRVRLAYSEIAAPLDKRISLVVDTITIGDALQVLLRGTGTEVSVTANGLIMLGRASPRQTSSGATIEMAQPGTGTITGAIVDTVTREVVPYVIVSVDDGAQSVRAGAQGQYTISGVAAGEHRVTAKRVGFIPKTRTVVVEEGKTATVNFVINRPPTHLDEVVTTALGDQRRYQVGNVIATVNVDSIAPTAPVTSITDLLEGRVTGLNILETGGLVGSGQAMRIRGDASLILQGDPILIVDGVRQDNAAGGSYVSVGGVSTHISPSRINDIDFSQVETIDVLKGPAASTEYGTDAANGVIVITTKRGAAGATRWASSAEQDASTMPASFPEYYYSWGHTTGASQQVVECPLVARSGSASSTGGTCAVDSVTHFDPLNHSAYSVYGTGFRNKYDLSLSGGTDAVRYYVAGNLSNETGIARLPDVFHQEAQALGFPSSVDNPNSLGQRSGRANTTMRLNSSADIALNVAYLSTDALTPGLQGGAPAIAAPSVPDSAHGYGYPSGNHSALSPLVGVGNTYRQNTGQLTGGLTLSWRPTAWLATHATVGLNHQSQQTQGLWLPQAIVVAHRDTSNGQLSRGDVGTDVYSTDLRASANVPVTRGIRTITSLGFQLTDTRSQGVVASANGNIGAANLTLNGLPPQDVSVSDLASRSAALGGYVEETIGFADRLFLTGAGRFDAASGFGSGVHVVPYPKVSASWLPLATGRASLRLRGAFGVASKQPLNGAALELTQLTTAWVNSGYSGGYQITTPGNPLLKPERSEEYEGGFDLGLWGNRLSVEFSAYQKTTHDALYDLALGWDLGYQEWEENLGEITNSGLEGTVTAVVVDSRALLWSFTVNGSVNHNKLVHLAPGAVPIPVGQAQQIQPGYPLNGFWGAREHYADLNHDGIIEPNEVTLDTAQSYMGSSVPTQMASLATHMGVLRSAITVNALFDYRGGYRVYNALAQHSVGFYDLQEQNVRGEPLWLQARDAATFTQRPAGVASGFFENGTMVRFRELSLSYTMPRQWVRALRLANVSVTGGVRNLALWTRYTGGDPEVSDAIGDTQYINHTFAVDNNARSSGANYAAVPLTRDWFARLNVGF